MNDLPYVSRYKGLASDGQRLNLEIAISKIFGDDEQKFENRMRDVSEELNSLGITGGQVKMAGHIAMYHAAAEYCNENGHVMDSLFPGVRRDFDALRLNFVQRLATYDAFQESEFDDNYRASPSYDESGFAAINAEFDRILEELRD